MIKKNLFRLAVVALLFTGCEKSTTSVDTTLKYSFSAINLSSTLGATTTSSGVPVAVNTNGSINWTGVSINVNKLELSATRAGSTYSFEQKNFMSVNTLRPDSLSGSVTLKSGVYEKLQFKLTMTESTSNPPFILTGTYIEASGTKIPVIVQLNQSQLINLELARLEVDKGTFVAKVTLEVNALVKGLLASDFGQTTRTGSNNTILVNSTTNRALYEKLITRIPNMLSISVAKQ